MRRTIAGMTDTDRTDRNPGQIVRPLIRVRQYRQFAGRPEGDHVLIGVARFLTAHAPTVRATGQTYDIAARLHRGEALHAD